MRGVTAGLGILTAVLAGALATPPGQALFGPGAAFPGPALTVIRDGGEPAGSAPSPPSGDEVSAPAAPAPAGAPSVRPIPTVPPMPGSGRPGPEESQMGLEQIARIANILLNLPQVLSAPHARPPQGSQEEWP